MSCDVCHALKTHVDRNSFLFDDDAGTRYCYECFNKQPNPKPEVVGFNFQEGGIDTEIAP